MSIKTLKHQILAAMEIEPTLTDFGLGTFKRRGQSKEERQLAFERDRAALLDYTDEFAVTCEWLSRIDKIKSLNRHHSSYGLKHIVEMDTGYISNGVLIAAAIHLGFEYSPIYWKSSNVWFNMSERSIKAAIVAAREASRLRHPLPTVSPMPLCQPITPPNW